MKKFLLSLILLSTLAIGVLIATIASNDFEELYQDFIQNASEDPSSVEIGDINIKYLPVPYVDIEYIKHSKNLQLNKVRLTFSLISLLQMNPKIQSIKIADLELSDNNSSFKFATHDEFIKNFINKNQIHLDAQINSIKVINDKKENLFTMRDTYYYNDGKNTILTGYLDDFGDLNAKLSRNSESTELNIKIKNQYENIALNETYTNDQLESGNIDINSKLLLHRISSFMPDLLSKIGNLESDQPISLKFNISPTEDSIKLTDIQIASESIEGNGEMIFPKNKSEYSTIKLNFNRLDFVTWNDENIRAKEYINGFSNKMDFEKNPILCNINFDTIKLSDDTSIKNVKFNSYTKNKFLIIKEFTGEDQKHGDFNISGKIEQNKFRSLFDGKISLSHHNLSEVVGIVLDTKLKDKQIPFSLYADIKLSSVDLSIHNLFLQTNSSRILGNLSSKFIGSSPRTHANLRISYANLDKNNLPILSLISNYTESLFLDMHADDYQSKFSKLRKINSTNHLDFVFDKLKYNGITYNNLNFSTTIKSGMISINDLFIDDGKNWLDVDLSLDSRTITPNIIVDIKDGMCSFDLLSPTKLLKIKEYLVQNFDLSKILLKYNLNLQEVKDSHSTISNLKTQGSNNGNSFIFNNLSFDINNGRVQSSGNILLNPFTFNFSYAINQADFDGIIALLSPFKTNSKAKISASGNWSTKGDDLDNLLYNLYSKSKILISDADLNNISIDEFISIINTYDYNLNSLGTDMRKHLLEGKTKLKNLRSKLELSKGIAELSNITFQTTKTSGSAEAKINIYKQEMKAKSNLSFYGAVPNSDHSLIKYDVINLPLDFNGSLSSLDKSSDTTELVKMIKKRERK